MNFSDPSGHIQIRGNFTDEQKKSIQDNAQAARNMLDTNRDHLQNVRRRLAAGKSCGLFCTGFRAQNRLARSLGIDVSDLTVDQIDTQLGHVEADRNRLTENPNAGSIITNGSASDLTGINLDDPNAYIPAYVRFDKENDTIYIMGDYFDRQSPRPAGGILLHEANHLTTTWGDRITGRVLPHASGYELDKDKNPINSVYYGWDGVDGAHLDGLPNVNDFIVCAIGGC